jgi:hypothetical protein
MRDQADVFRIATARGALDAGLCAVNAALVATIAGWWIAANWIHAPLAAALLVVVSTASGVAAVWYAMRIAIDRRLFAVLADALIPEARVDETLAGLDEALGDAGWSSAAGSARPLSARVRGTVGLLRASVIVAAVQWLVVCVALVARAPG